MHSSRMRAARSSSHLGRGVSGHSVCVCLGACLPRGGLPGCVCVCAPRGRVPRRVSAQLGVCLGGRVCVSRGGEQND